VHYLDWLQVLAVLGVFLFHAIHPFDDLADWHIKNMEKSILATFFAGFFNLWGMPFFFLMAGATSWFSLRRRTAGLYARERVKRLLIPFIFGVLVLSPIQAYFELIRRREWCRPYLSKIQLLILKGNQTQAFIVIQDDTILYEKYFSGATRDTIVTSFSCAKQWDSALIGAAIDDGYIQSVDDSITDYLPELAERDPAFSDITIYDLLRMSSSIEYDGLGGLEGDDSKTYYYPDLRKLALEETIVVDSPGSGFLYNNYHPLLLGMILERATGMSVTDYLEIRIWQPIGMEFDGSWSLDSETSGFEKMESGINGRAIDFAKFGRLYLNNGNWDGTQVLPADWIVESTRPDTDSVGYYPYYKYAWESKVRGESDYDYYAEGHNGQGIYVSPHNNLIIVRNGEAYGEFGQT
jgi:CubicO group peptidase (beta-lactamase class C family)